MVVWIDAEPGPFGGDVAGLLEQLALRGLEVRLARLELAGRDLDELAPRGVAELALEQQPAVVEQRDDRDRAGVADVFAAAFAAVGQAHGVAVHLEELAVEHQLPGDKVLSKVGAL